MKKIILGFVIAFNLYGATQKDATQDPLKIKNIENYIQSTYNLDKMLFNAGDIAMVDILFLDKLKVK